MIYFCCDERRRQTVREQSTLNGIDFLEVLDLATTNQLERQRKLFVHLLKPLTGTLTKDNVRIEGGKRIRNVRVTDVVSGIKYTGMPGTGNEKDVLTVTVDSVGDFSTYRLRLVRSATDEKEPDGFDPLLSAVDFSFKVECSSDFDCRTERVCPPEPRIEPNIDYLAKDYASFRQLMLDRMGLLMPQWKERNPADIGIVLVELLAYVGDYLSYQQDAVATEAYLGTARRRVSVRRHARLVDYFMHDGSNARLWAQVQVSADNVKLGKGAKLLTSIAGAPKRITPNSLVYTQAMANRPEVFETIHEMTLFQAHNEMHFYTWGARECCLPKGATCATLKGHYPRLKEGDVLVFEEVLGPQTGQPADADPAHRHAVRLIKISLTFLFKIELRFQSDLDNGTISEELRQAFENEKISLSNNATALIEEKGSRWLITDADNTYIVKSENNKLNIYTLPKDPLGGRFDEPPTDNPAPVTEITWATEDALPFALCISAKTDADHGSRYLANVSVARGNIVLADYGWTIEGEELGEVPLPTILRPMKPGADRCAERKSEPVPPRFRPRLKEAPLTQSAPYDEKKPPKSANAAMNWATRDLLPQIKLEGELSKTTKPWEPKRDLLNSNPDTREFVVEIEVDGTAYLRFGDDEYGLRPASGTRFTATYRIGNGVRGNVGAEALGHIVSTDSAIEAVRNPMPARGGIEPESMERVRQDAPSAFRIQERAVTAEDYAEVAERHPEVQRAAATVRWTGSWRTIFLTIDRRGGRRVDDKFEQEMRRHLERYRMAGHDVEIDGPRFVPLEINMFICVQPGYFRSDVKAALLQVFSNTTLPDGRRGLFHPDNFTFGQPVYLSRLYAAAQAMEGVRYVEFKKFQRLGIDSNEALTEGRLEIGRLEIAQLDNDANFQERGVLRFFLSV